MTDPVRPVAPREVNRILAAINKLRLGYRGGREQLDREEVLAIFQRQGCACRCCDHAEGSDCACDCHADGDCAVAPVQRAASPADPRVEVEAEEGCFAVDVWTGDEAFRLNVFDTFEEAESYRRIVAETFGLRATASTEAGRVDKGWFARQAQRTAEDIKQLPDWLRATGEGARDAMDTNHNRKPAAVGDEPVRGHDAASDPRRIQGQVAVSLDPHRLQAMADAVCKYVEWHGGIHDDGCPQDDTCDCSAKPINDGVNAACRYLTELARLRGEATVRVEE